jgi:phosphatidylinositol glycan class C protein
MSSVNPPSEAPMPRPGPSYATRNGPSQPFSHRTSLRISTAKSALLIYFTLLGLSPILKSLTRSTSSDSIWAMSFLLFTINIFFFDYGSAPARTSAASANKNIPASLSTNAALMASTVLASRLPSTGQVFSLTLFSIEVFGLFPVFRRYARQWSWRGHVALTSLLVLGAGGGVGLILGHGGDGDGLLDFPWKSGIMGTVIGVLVTGLAMGGCSWWLIGLQKYKNEIHGPWDPARPVIRRRWDDY